MAGEGKAVWSGELSIFYPHPLDSLSAWRIAGSAVVLLAISALAWRFRNRAPYLLVGWSWYIVTLLPVIGIVQVGTQAMADRYSYVPMAGLLIVSAWGTRDIAARAGGATKIVVVIGACAIVTTLAVMTWSRIGIWRDSETLYRSTLATMPGNPLAAMGLGSILVKKQHYDEAIPLLESALSGKHREKEAHYHLGIAFQNTYDYQKAESHYRSAVGLDPDYSEAWNNLGVTLSVLGKPSEALAALVRAVDTGPNNVEAAVNLIRYLIQLGRIGDAQLSIGDEHRELSAAGAHTDRELVSREILRRA